MATSRHIEITKSAKWFCLLCCAFYILYEFCLRMVKTVDMHKHLFCNAIKNRAKGVGWMTRKSEPWARMQRPMSDLQWMAHWNNRKFSIKVFRLYGNWISFEIIRCVIDCSFISIFLSNPIASAFNSNHNQLSNILTFFSWIFLAHFSEHMLRECSAIEYYLLLYM